MNHYFITVPLNEDGIKEYDVGVEESENMEVFVFDEYEFSDMKDALREISNVCGFIIEEYERATVEANKVEEAFDSIRNMDMPEGLERAFRIALQKKQPVYMDF